MSFGPTMGTIRGDDTEVSVRRGHIPNAEVRFLADDGSYDIWYEPSEAQIRLLAGFYSGLVAKLDREAEEDKKT